MNLSEMTRGHKHGPMCVICPMRKLRPRRAKWCLYVEHWGMRNEPAHLDVCGTHARVQLSALCGIVHVNRPEDCERDGPYGPPNPNRTLFFQIGGPAT